MDCVSVTTSVSHSLIVWVYKTPAHAREDERVDSYRLHFAVLSYGEDVPKLRRSDTRETMNSDPPVSACLAVIVGEEQKFTIKALPMETSQSETSQQSESLRQLLRPAQSSPTETSNSEPQTPTNNNSSGSQANKAKAKKRKKSGYGGYIDLITFKAIQPKDVQEVMRRFGQNIGPFASQHVRRSDVE
ncbi:Hypothetical predicted protein [Mytilus galloprovincialis]|uniref:Uncharacterized protein n=1 Tax=Mytilus galloprovincialis TaxID=29158 RepID=A0A8B6ESS5_MYTGA|nr:Hypothetical predicted protein [Mytilus galloprovincialis]